MGSYLNRFGTRQVFDQLETELTFHPDSSRWRLVFRDSAYFCKHPKFRQLQLRKYTSRNYNDALREITLYKVFRAKMIDHYVNQ